MLVVDRMRFLVSYSGNVYCCALLFITLNLLCAKVSLLRHIYSYHNSQLLFIALHIKAICSTERVAHFVMRAWCKYCAGNKARLLVLSEKQFSE